MAKIIYSQEALDNLLDIQAYYRREFSLETATKVLDSIVNDIERLSYFPNLGGIAPSLRLHRRGYKKLISQCYVVLYKYNKDEDVVYIAHIYRTTQNYK